MDRKSIALIVILALTMSAVFAKNHYKTASITETVEADYKYFSLETPTEPSKEAKILFLGDMMMGRYVRVLMDRHGLNYPFEKLPEDFFQGYDLVVANLEGPITERFITGGTSLVFGFPPDTAQILADQGVDIVTLGNNHTLNRGEEGYEETLNYLSEAGIRYLGHQHYEDYETSVFIKNINGIKIAFISIHDAERRINEKVTLEMISQAKKESNYVVLQPHWGIEYRHTASERQQRLAKEWLAAGADVVIGHHPHVVQEIDFFDEGIVFYSLGNFIFDQYFSQDVQEELALVATFKTNNIDFELIPMGSIRSQSYVMDEAKKEKFLQKLARWSELTDTNPLHQDILEGKITQL